MNNEQRGVALLIVLMLLALMAALAADMTLSFPQPASANPPGKPSSATAI
mgnify:CR=1 FL=1